MIPKPLAVIRAIDAVHLCLQTHLPAILDELELDEEGLQLPAPDKYSLALSPTGVEESIVNGNVAVWIFQSSESEIFKKNSGTPLGGEAYQRTFIEVRIAYNARSAVPYKPPGWTTPLSQQDTLARRGYFYVAALMKCLLTKLCCTSPDAVSQVSDVSNDFAGSVFEFGKQQWGGLGTVVFELEQVVTIPKCSHEAPA